MKSKCTLIKCLLIFVFAVFLMWNFSSLGMNFLRKTVKRINCLTCSLKNSQNYRKCNEYCSPIYIRCDSDSQCLETKGGYCFNSFSKDNVDRKFKKDGECYCILNECKKRPSRIWFNLNNLFK